LSQAGIGIGRLAYPAFDAERGLFTLHVLDAGGDPTHMAPGGSQPAWRADGGALTFRGTSGAEGLYLQVGDEPAALLILGAAFYPSFSPDGSLIAYEARDTGQIAIVRADCQQTAEGCRPQALTSGRAPLWGPGGLIAYNACTDEGCGLFVIDPAVGGPPQRLTGHADDLPGAWSPDGARIAFMSDSGGDWDVFVISLSGEFTRLTDSPHSDGLPAWSPDGRMIAFVSDRDGRWGLYLMDLDGGGPPRKIVDLGLRPPYWPDERVSWGP
jgi:TolB protein